MMLDEPFEFEDSEGTSWIAPKGTFVNGLSFPEWRKNQSVWKNVLFIIGSIPIKAMSWSPFVSRARRASVLHDYYCKTMERSAATTHKMFHEAMLEDNTPRWQADLFYNSVMTFKKW